MFLSILSQLRVSYTFIKITILIYWKVGWNRILFQLMLLAIIGTCFAVNEQVYLPFSNGPTSGISPVPDHTDLLYVTTDVVYKQSTVIPIPLGKKILRLDINDESTPGSRNIVAHLIPEGRNLKIRLEPIHSPWIYTASVQVWYAPTSV